jgi:2-polyprenyl-6-methoxyphenol hydroxylase-like FAD-dependent oxidoreductase
MPSTPSQTYQVSIIGAGVAGLASAIALKQQGVEVRIFERTQEQQHLGAGIVLWPNAMFVLDALGLSSQVLKVSAPLERMQRFNAQNLPLDSLAINELNESAGYTSRSILRADLMALLLDYSEKLQIPIHYQHSLTGISQDTSSVTLSFKAQKDYNTDVLIGADGRMQSIVRRFILGDNQPVYQKFINVIGLSRHSDYTNQKDVLDYWGVGSRFGIVPVAHPTNSDSKSANAYWAAGWYQDVPNTHNKVDRDTPESILEELLTRFNHWPTAVKQALINSESDSIRKLSIYDHNPNNVWSKGNILMIGDAAHAALPTSGQGACQALEDAWWLAKLIAKDGINAECFEKFSQQRFVKTQAIIQSGRSMAKTIFNPDAQYCQTRDSKLSESKSSDASAIANFWMQGLES